MKISNMLPKTTLAEKLDKTGDSKNNTVTFTSKDSTAANTWTDVNLLASGEKHSSILNKVSTMFKNIRFLYKMLGTTDISTIGNGTVTGAIVSQNETFTQQINTLNTNLNSTKVSLLKIKTQTYTVSCTTFDTAFNMYKGQVSISNDVPTGTILFAAPSNGRNTLYESHSCYGYVLGNNLYINSSVSSPSMQMTMLWIYK